TLLTLRTLRTRPRFVLSLHNRASGQGLRAKVETRVETMLARGAELVLGASTDLVERAQDLGADDARFLTAAAPDGDPGRDQRPPHPGPRAGRSGEGRDPGGDDARPRRRPRPRRQHRPRRPGEGPRRR